MEWDKYKIFTKFLGQRILAVDYGTKVAGLACFRPGSDPFPLGLGRIIVKSEDQLMTDIVKLIQEEDIEALVFGIPYLTDGQETLMGETIKVFSEKVQQEAKTDLYFQDETLSSFEAKERMKSSAVYNFKVDLKRIDELCATIILEDFIRSEGLSY